jgi:hypothetical protein
MRVNYSNNTIEKPAGKRTPAKTIQFDELKQYIDTLLSDTFHSKIS